MSNAVPAIPFLQNRVAIVTGGASGIGLGVSQRLARMGYPVAILDKQRDVLHAAVEELVAGGLNVVGETVDVADRVAVNAAIRSVRTRLGNISIIVTSAGIDANKPFEEISLDEWEHVLKVNLTGTFNCIQPVVADMVAAGWGRIITISSSSAQSGAGDRAHYIASKGGVIALTKALSYEYAPKGITVNTIPPSIIETPMLAKATEEGRFPGAKVVAAITPVRRVGTADDVAAACAFLCSDDASFITGQQIGVNGGLYM